MSPSIPRLIYRQTAQRWSASSSGAGRCDHGARHGWMLEAVQIVQDELADRFGHEPSQPGRRNPSETMAMRSSHPCIPDGLPCCGVLPMPKNRFHPPAPRRGALVTNDGKCIRLNWSMAFAADPNNLVKASFEGLEHLNLISRMVSSPWCPVGHGVVRWTATMGLISVRLMDG